MAFLFGDSVDHLTTAQIGRKGYSPGRSGYATVGAYGRNSTNGFRIAQAATNSATEYMDLPALTVSGNVCIFNIAIKRTASAGTYGLYEILRNGATQLAILMTSSGVLQFRRGALTFGSGTLITTTATSITAGVSTHVQIKVTCHPSAGTIDVKFDGINNDATAYGLTGLNTAATGSAGWSQPRMGTSLAPSVGNPAVTCDIDDIVILDGSGSSPWNDFLGDVRGMYFPSASGNGHHDQFTRSSGSDSGALVSDATPDDLTSYLSSSVSGHRVTHTKAAMGVTGTVYAVQTVPCVKAAVAGVRAMGATFRIGSTDYDASGVAVPSDWVSLRQVHQVSPATASAWTVSEIDGMEFGQKVTA